MCSIVRRVSLKNGDFIFEQWPQHWIRFLETRVVSLSVLPHNVVEFFEALPLVGFNIKGKDEVAREIIRDRYFFAFG